MDTTADRDEVRIFESSDSTEEDRPERDVEPLPKMVALSHCMRNVLAVIEKFSGTNAPILITGETGTGKELAARMIHAQNPERKHGPFVPINCGAIPETLLESELFGHEKGAFTGAYARKRGKAETAHTGTLFLDEVAELPLSLQVKLLRFIEDLRFERVGGNQSIKVDVQIIAATNRNLSECTKKGSFREDLYYRLAVLCLHLPPLRERQEDLIFMAERFLIEYAKKLSVEPKQLHPETINVIKRYNWPGNVRELLNKMRRAIVLSENDYLTAIDMGLEEIKDASSSLRLSEAKQRLERQYLMKALIESKGNVSKAARHLDVSRPHLYALMKKFGVDRKVLSYEQD